MTIKYNEKRGVWEAFYSARHPVTRQPITLRRQASSESEAKKLEKEIIRQVRGRLIEESSPAWRRVVSEFLIDRRERGITEHSIHDYQTALEKFTFGSWSNKRINEITTQNVWDIMRGALVTEKSRPRQKDILKFIRGAFEFAVQRGYI